MTIGKLKYFNAIKGFGFIQPIDGGPDVFVHITAIENAGLRDLLEGQVLTYEIVTERGRPAAANIAIVSE